MRVNRAKKGDGKKQQAEGGAGHPLRQAMRFVSGPNESGNRRAAPILAK
jgi:hypothetical protein